MLLLSYTARTSNPVLDIRDLILTHPPSLPIIISKVPYSYFVSGVGVGFYTRQCPAFVVMRTMKK